MLGNYSDIEAWCNVHPKESEGIQIRDVFFGPRYMVNSVELSKGFGSTKQFAMAFDLTAFTPERMVKHFNKEYNKILSRERGEKC